MATRYSGLTPARRAALKKAQAASAAKRRGKGKGKLAAANRRATRNGRIARGVAYTAVGAGIAAAAYVHVKNSKGNSHTSPARGARPQATKGRDHVNDFVTATKHFNARHGSPGGVRDSHRQGQRFGLKDGKRKTAESRLKAAAHGTSGSHKRTFVSQRTPAHTQAPAVTRQQAIAAAAKKTQARRLRVAAKVAARHSPYNPARHAFVATTKGVSHRR